MGKPMQNGFSMFSIPHIVTLAVIIAVSVSASVFFNKLSGEQRNRISLVLGIVIAAADMTHYIVYYFLGILSVFAIPLHLCALAVYVCLLHSIFRSDWMGQVLYDLCLPGVWCALIFPDWVRFPFFSYPSLDSFIIHGLIAVYITMQLAARRIIPRLRAIWKPVLFLCVTAPFAALANHFLGTNFMFISQPAPGSPLEWLSALSGGVHALYLMLFALLAILVMVIMYLPFEFRRRINNDPF